ncbi:MAG: DUF1232 domain-containing protein [Bacteroidia bacterium]|nr:DUF1232 domain-containing protein [Bacteroidia bacterium]
MDRYLKQVFIYASRFLEQLSTKGIYIILLLYYAFKNDHTPAWAKRIIIGTIAYFLSPIDSIPDLAPFIGMTDDIGVLSFGLVTIACYINNEVRHKAIEKLESLIPEKIDQQSIEDVDSWL